jgi:hypothetical protein
MGRESGHHYRKTPFSELILDPGFIGLALAPAVVLFGAAVVGWTVGKLLKPLRPHASWTALAGASVLFLAMIAGNDIGNQRTKFVATQPPPANTPTPTQTEIHSVKPQKPPPSNPVAPSNVATELQKLASTINAQKHKSLGEHLTILQAIPNNNVIQISMRMSRYSATDAEIQPAIH